MNIDDNSFDKVIQSKLVLVDFWADWCKPCLALNPILDELANEYKEIEFVNIDVGKYTKVAARYGVMNLPTMILFKDGKPVSHIVGFKSKADLKRKLEEV